MSWQYVLDIKKKLLIKLEKNASRNVTFDDAMEMCARSGYVFFCFNGLVYFMADEVAFTTGITAEDLY